ncbi:MAG: Glutathione S-transferase [Pseudomonadota bacterium]|jgi:glutathione S-transferase
MSMKLYFSPGACSFVPHALLEMAGAAFEPQIVKLAAGEQRSPEYLAINPRAQVPVLMVDGFPLTQVVAIVNYIHDRFPAAQFLPQDPLAKAKVLSTLAWMNNSFHPTFTHVFRTTYFASTEAGIADVKAFNTTKYQALLKELDGMVAAKTTEWLGGTHPGPLDLYAMVLTRWGSLGAGQDPTLLPALWDHAQKIAALPAVARTIERERIKLNMFTPPEAKAA